jgi:hypothetical protein
VHKDQYVCIDVFQITGGRGVRLPCLQGHLISVDTVFITVEPGYNVMTISITPMFLSCSPVIV